VGPLRPGVTVAQALADVRGIAAYLARTYPHDNEGLLFGLARPGLGGNMLGGPGDAFCARLVLVSALILLAACANLGSLFAARASDRAKEIALRLALGASREEILRASLGRAFRLLTIGSVAGLVLGVLATQVLAHIVYLATPKDPLVLGGVAVSMLLLGLIASWIPARRALAVDPLVLLRDE